jgi:GNAT superfamily N-acetyltransferase
MEVTIRELDKSEIFNIGLINREEEIACVYVGRTTEDGMGIILHSVKEDPPVSVSRWDEDDVAYRAGKWEAELDRGGLLLGAFVGPKWVGFAVLGHKLPDASGELCALFVDKDFRSKAIGSALMRTVEERARELEIKSIFIHSNPTVATVDFYRKHCYRVISAGDTTISDSLPCDPVLGKRL